MTPRVLTAALTTLCTACTLLNDLPMSETTPELCTNGRDDDNDGLVDCEDFGCRNLQLEACREKTASLCTDGTDNDNDGYTDCADEDCFLSGVCPENDERTCTDGADNDDDRDTDCEDRDCWSVVTTACDPAEYGSIILDDGFDSGDLDHWTT